MLYGIIAAVIAVLALAAAIIYRRRLRSYGVGEPELTDEVIRRIEEVGRVDLDEPLDLEEIREEEERFWQDQPWEEPEEW